MIKEGFGVATVEMWVTVVELLQMGQGGGVGAIGGQLYVSANERVQNF